MSAKGIYGDIHTANVVIGRMRENQAKDEVTIRTLRSENARLRGALELASGCTPDGDCVACGQDGSEPNFECHEHEPFDLTSDDAVETLHSLIRAARAALATKGGA